MKKGFKDFKKQLISIIKKPEMRILPGQLAFFLLLSIVPLLMVVVVVASQFSLSIDAVTDSLKQAVPKEVFDFIIAIFNSKKVSINIIIFCISGFILASNGPHSMIISSNLLYKIKDKDFLTRRVKALIMTIFVVILFLFILVVPVFGNQIIKVLTEMIPSDSVVNAIKVCYDILKYPTTILIIFMFIKILYTMAPDKKIPSKNTTTGALFTTLGWIVCTEIYSLYVNRLVNYNLLYGSLANLIILLIWIYLLSYIFVLGMALNAVSYEEEKITNE